MGDADDLWCLPGLEVQGARIVFDVTAETLTFDLTFRQSDRDDVYIRHRTSPLIVISEPRQNCFVAIEPFSPRRRRRPRSEGVSPLKLSLIHISEPTRLGMTSYAVFCL